MCLAIPGKIISKKGQQAVVDFSGLKKEVNVSLVNAKKGDCVVVHAGFAIEKLKKSEADDLYKLFGK
jgi:hydrogenase expression/formation protein HypC